MTEQALLNKLHDIVLPPAIGLWPLAYGWYILIFGVLSSLFCMGWYYQKNQLQREALQLLKQYQKAYLESQNSQVAIVSIAELLKRVALVYFPHKQVAALQDAAWIHFLNQHTLKGSFTPFQFYLTTLPYQPNPAPVDSDVVQTLFATAKRFIAQRTKPCFI